MKKRTKLSFSLRALFFLVTALGVVCGVFVLIQPHMRHVVAEVVESPTGFAMMGLVALWLGCWTISARIRNDAAFVLVILLGIVFLALAILIPTIH